MKFVDLSRHLRQLRSDRTGRLASSAMNAIEVWQGALECPQNGIGQIYYNDANLPAPLLGFFARMRGPLGDVADIYVHKPHGKSNKRRLARHWKEFVIIKELMHCWSPTRTYNGTANVAADLLSDLNTPSGPFGVTAQADYVAILAAAEVILPGAPVKKAIAQGKEIAQIAVEHALHPELVAYICRHDILEARMHGSL